MSSSNKDSSESLLASGKRQREEQQEEKENPDKSVQRFELKITETKFAEPDFEDAESMVRFIIGEQQKPFEVHRESACYYSPVLKKAFEGEFVEGQTQTYTLDNVDPEIFQRLVKWIYRQAIIEPKIFDMLRKSRIDQGFLRKSQTAEINLEQKQIMELWILADRFLMRDLQNACTAYILATLRDFRTFPSGFFSDFLGDDVELTSYSNTCLSDIFEQSAIDSPLNKLIVDTLMTRTDPTSLYVSLKREIWGDLARALAVRMAEQRIKLSGESKKWDPLNYAFKPHRNEE